MTQAPPLPPTVRFEHRLAVTAFLQQRLRHHNLTPARAARVTNATSDKVLSQLLNGRGLLTRSKYCDPVCLLLHITPEGREAIHQVEQRSRRAWRVGH